MDTIGLGSTVIGVDASELHPVADSINVNVATPALNPVTVPLAMTLAILLSLLIQAPPNEGCRFVVSPMHISSSPVTLMVGGALTMRSTFVDAEHPVVAFVNVNKTVPAAIPVAIPLFVMVAIAPLLLVQDPPVDGLKVVLSPIQIDEDPRYVTVGGASTTISSVGAELHPLAFSNTKVALPGDTAVTIPALVTVAIAELLLVHIPPVPGEREDVSPTQILPGPVTFTTAGPTTVNTSLESETQPELPLVKINLTVPGATPVIIP